MNNNGCQICFILLPNLLVWIEIIKIQKLVTHVTHAFLAYSIYTSAIRRRRVISKCRASPRRTQSRRLPEFGYGPLVVCKPHLLWCCQLANPLSCLNHATSSVASPMCQEGQSERNFPIFAFSSRFVLFFPIFPWFFPDFFLLFPDFGQIFRCQGWHSAPLATPVATPLHATNCL